MTSSTTRPMRRLAVLAIAAALAAAALTSCNESVPRDVYDSFRHAYWAGDYNAMAALLSQQSSDRLAKERGGATKALMEDLPPLEKVKALALPLANERLNDPKFTDAEQKDRLKEAIDAGSVFEIIEAASAVARTKGGKSDFLALNLRWVRVFTVPENEIGRSINFVAQPPGGYLMTMKLGAEVIQLPLQNDNGKWKISWK